MGYDPIENVELKDVEENELRARGVMSLATRPNAPSRYGEGGLTAEDLKEKFDGLARALAGRINTIHKYLRADDLAKNIKVDIYAEGENGIQTLAALAEAIESGVAAKYFTVKVGTNVSVSLQAAIDDILKDISDHGEASDENFRSTNARINKSVATINIKPVVNGGNITIVLTAMNDQGEVVTTNSINVPNADNLIASHNESTDAHQDIRGDIQSNGMQIDSLREDIADVRVVAEGRVRARAYRTWNDALLAISSFGTLEEARKEFAIGDQIYIRTPKSTDAWVSGFETRHEPYPGGLGDDLDPFDKWESTEIHVGYLIISPLESPDIDLTGYVTTDDFSEYGKKVGNDIADAKAHSVAEAKAYTAEEVTGVSDRVEILGKKVENLRAALSPEYFTEDSSVAYSKTVPAAALPFAEVQEVGGMSYAEGGMASAAVTEIETVGYNVLDLTPALNNRLIDNGDGTYTLRKVNGERFSEFFPIYIPKGQQVFCYLEIVSTNIDGLTRIPLQLFGADKKDNGASIGISNGGQAFSPMADTFFAKAYLQHNDAEGAYVTFRNPMIKYGKSAEFSPYAKHTYPIPAEVQALDGYGLGIGADCHNRLDLGKKQYRQEVCKIRLDGSEGWSKTPTSNIFQAGCPLPKIAGATETLRPIISNGYGFSDWYNPDASVKPYFRIVPNGDRLWIEATPEQFASVDAWKAYLAEHPVEILYPLASPIVTDLPDLPDDNFIEVEGGGTITAVNEYALAAPTKIEYQLKEATA